MPVTQTSVALSTVPAPAALTGLPLVLAQLRAFIQTTPGKLRLWQLGGIALTLLFGLSVWNYDRYVSSVARTMTTDTVPSIVSAETLRTQLSNANASMVNAFLTKNMDPQSSDWVAYRNAVHAAQQSYFEAAQNITFGDTERKPLFEVMSGLEDYDRLVGGALDKGQFSDDVITADRLMQDRILPAAVALDQANYSVLDEVYGSFKSRHMLHSIMMFVCGFALATYLIYAQLFLRRQSNRLFNPGLLAATLVFGIGSFGLMLCSSHAGAALQSAKEDAFDSLHMLAKAKAVAYAANTDESMFLLVSGNAALQADSDKQFRLRALAIEAPKGTSVPADNSLVKSQGYLRDELNNLTFEGEEALAQKTLTAWELYMAVDGRIRQLEHSGQHAQAVKLDLGHDKGESNWAFGQFDAALDQVTALNHTEFKSRGASATRNIARLVYVELALVLLVSAAIFFGFKPRLDEYRF